MEAPPAASEMGSKRAANAMQYVSEPRRVRCACLQRRRSRGKQEIAQAPVPLDLAFKDLDLGLDLATSR